MSCTRREYLARGLAGATALVCAGARAQAFPDRPLRMVVPFPPGGPTDIFGRIIAAKLSAHLGQQVVVHNRPGAGSILGTDFVAKSRPDGYTILFGTAAHAINASLYKKLPYDSLGDFDPIALVGVVPLVLLAPPRMPDNLKDFVVQIRASPDRYTFASSGVGTVNHLAGEMLNAAEGLKARHIPYKGAAPALQGLLGGEVSFMFETFGTALPHLQSGKLRAIAVAWNKRSSAAAEVPTFTEAGMPGFQAATWNTVSAPAGTPAPVVARLNAAINEVMRESSVTEQMFKLGIAAVDDSTPQSCREMIAAEIKRWAAAVQSSGATAE
ncbi:MAG: Bug family tripartite tricarboxylate transporter substrate binding protein [Lautropia sp.]